MPKSSIAIFTPISESRLSSMIMPSVWRMTWLSVISSSRLEASRPVSASTRVTMSRKALSLNWRADRLTAMRSAGSPRSCHSLAWRQPSRSTHSPMSLMRPVSSASGMKSPGITVPLSSVFQRTSASTALIFPDSRSICGW